MGCSSVKDVEFWNAGTMEAPPTQADYVIGIDGGGSRCRSRLRDADGRLLASVHGGAANVTIDFDAALATVQACILETLRQAGVSARVGAGVRVGLGLAGAASRSVADQVESMLGGPGDVMVVNDAVTACIGAHAGQDGGLVVAGTGSVAIARLAGADHIVGGRGFMLGDDGSGARIGLEAWRRALRAHDGLEPTSDLTRQLMALFNNDPGAVIRWGSRAKSSDYGAHAPAIFVAAGKGDPVAVSIVTQAADALCELARAVQGLGVERMALVGGIADAIRPYLPGDMIDLLGVPMLDATEGAIMMVGGRVPYLGTLRSMAVSRP